MGSNIGLIGMGVIAIFATSFIKVAAVGAIVWGIYKCYRDWELTE
jgi:hypothetical protein